MRITKTVTAAAAIGALLTVPGPALAAGHHHHQAGSRHHAAAHVKRIRTITSPAAPQGQASPSGAGQVTVASFKDGLLTLKLADGTTVSGTVDPSTQIACAPAASPTTAPTATAPGHHGDGEQGDVQEGNQGNPPSGAADDQGESQDGAGDDDSAQAGCSSTALVAGTVVRKARLAIGGPKAVFEQLELTVPAAA